jgi:hypothetical protein
MDAARSVPATYVYGVAPAEPFRNGSPRLRTPGIGGRGDLVRTIEFEDLVAVVSDVPGLRFDLSRENLLDHQRVLEEVLNRSDVLPFSFGTVAESDEEVRESLLRDGFHALHEQLAYIRGCVELEVKVFWDPERLFTEIAEENDDVRALRDAVAQLPEEAAYMEKITLGQLTQTEIDLKSEWEAEGALDVLAPYAIEVVQAPNLTETMLLNAAFLVERSREAEFDAVVTAFGEAQAGRLILHYVGPLPPYSFINLAFEPEG